MLRPMAKLGHSLALVSSVVSSLFILSGSALAQGAAPTGSAPASASFPPTEPAPTPVAPSPVAPAPAPVAPAAPAPVAPAPAPAPPPPPPPPAYPEPVPYGQSGYPAGDPPPPPQAPDEGFKIPDISIRIDPFNLLLEGRLGLELETQVLSFMTVELVPVFVTTKSPPTLNYSSYEDSILRQKSNGLGALSGAAIDAGFWFGGKPFRGNVLRVGLTNYGYQYDAEYDGRVIDTVKQTNRQFFVMLGQHSRWGAFTIAGGIGLGYELNKQNRCFDDIGAATSDCRKDQQLIKLNPSGSSTGDLHGFLYPFDLMARFSLGVVF
jgi:hypothetical protein